MNFFGSSLAIRDNFKVAFFGKNLANVISKEICAPFISGNQYDRLTHQSFFEAAASLSNNSRENSINTTRSKCSLQQKFHRHVSAHTAGQCQIYWEADPQPSAQVSYTASAQNSGTVSQDWQLWKAWTNYQTLFDFFSKNATFELSLMSNDENKFLPIFQILDIKNVSLLLKLEMALATTIIIKFELVCFLRAPEDFEGLRSQKTLIFQNAQIKV